MKLLASGALTAGSLIQKVEQGTFREFQLHFQGTAAASATVEAADLGTIEITRRGDSIVRLTAAQLQNINVLEGGVVDTTSTTGAAFSFTMVLPWYILGDSLNVLQILPTDNLRITVTYAASLAAKLAAGQSQTLSIYGIEGVGIQGYLRKLRGVDISVNAGDIPFSFPARNIDAIYVENDSNTTAIVMTVDGEKVIDCPLAELITTTLYHNKIETWSSTTPLLKIDLAPTGQLTEALSDNVNVVLTNTTTGTLSTIVSNLEFNVEDRARSIAAQELKLRQKQLNATNPV